MAVVSETTLVSNEQVKLMNIVTHSMSKMAKAPVHQLQQWQEDWS